MYQAADTTTVRLIRAPHVEASHRDAVIIGRHFSAGIGPFHLLSHPVGTRGNHSSRKTVPRLRPPASSCPYLSAGSRPPVESLWVER